MEYKKLRKDLIDKLAVSRQALWARADRIRRSKYGPMSLEEATALIAHDEGLNVSQYLEPSQLERIRQLAGHRAIMESPEPCTRATPTVRRVVKVQIAGEFKLSDPLLPERILEDARKMTKVYAQLYVFENSMREVIVSVLSRVHGDHWWDVCAPTRVHQRAKQRIEDADKNPWHGRARAHPLYFVDMPDLNLIMVKNWSHFEDLFPSQSWVSQKIDEIARSRNVVDHHNPLSKDDQDRLSVYFRDWCRQIQSVKDRLT